MAIGIEGICICIIANSIVIAIEPFGGIIRKFVFVVFDAVIVRILVSIITDAIP